MFSYQLEPSRWGGSIICKIYRDGRFVGYSRSFSTAPEAHCWGFENILYRISKGD